MPNFFDKERYVHHYQNLKLYLRLGLKLKNLCLLEFNQSQSLQPYVKFNPLKIIEVEKIVAKMKNVKIKEQYCIW